MSGRAWGMGTVYQRKDGRWVAAYSAASGKRKLVYTKSREEAEAVLVSARDRRLPGTKLEKAKRKRGEGSITYMRQRDRWRAVVMTTIGKRRAAEFPTQEQADEWREKVIAQGVNGKARPSERQRKNRQKKRGTGPRKYAREGLGLRMRFAVLERDDFTCQYCGRQAPDIALHVDHIIPVSAGGVTEMSNLATSCLDCNWGKRDKVLKKRGVAT